MNGGERQGAVQWAGAGAGVGAQGRRGPGVAMAMLRFKSHWVKGAVSVERREGAKA